MTPEMAIDIGRRAIELVLMMAAPMLLASLVVGLLVSIFQAATQINEQTMTFVPKIVAAFVALLIFSPWMINKTVVFIEQILALVATVGG